MSDLKDKGFSVREAGSLKEAEGPHPEDITEVMKFTREEAFGAGKRGFFFVPNKITYSRSTAGLEEVLAGLSRNKRKRIRRAVREFGGLEFVAERPITQESYGEWYSKLYVPGMESKSRGIVIAKSDWWKSERGGEKFGLFFRKGGEMVAGIMARSFRRDSTLPERFSISFSAVREDFRRTGINDYLNALAIDYAKKCGYGHIFRGRDTNLYGLHLSAGIPVYKISLGFDINPDTKSPDILIRLNRPGNLDTIFFVSYKRDMSLCGNLITSGEVSSQEAGEYLCRTVREVRVFRKDGNEIRLVERVSEKNHK